MGNSIFTPGLSYGSFGAELSLGAEGVGVHFQGLREAGAETLALDHHRRERLDVFNSGALYELVKGLGSLLAGADLHYDC